MIPSTRIAKIIKSTVLVGIAKRRHTSYFAEFVVGNSFVFRAHIKKDIYDYLEECGTPVKIIEPAPTESAPVLVRESEGPIDLCLCGCDVSMHAGRGRASTSSFCLSEYCECQEFVRASAAARAAQ